MSEYYIPVGTHITHLLVLEYVEAGNPRLALPEQKVWVQCQHCEREFKIRLDSIRTRVHNGTVGCASCRVPEEIKRSTPPPPYGLTELERWVISYWNVPNAKVGFKDLDL